MVVTGEKGRGIEEEMEWSVVCSLQGPGEQRRPSTWRHWRGSWPAVGNVAVVGIRGCARGGRLQLGGAGEKMLTVR